MLLQRLCYVLVSADYFVNFICLQINAKKYANTIVMLSFRRSFILVEYIHLTMCNSFFPHFRLMLCFKSQKRRLMMLMLELAIAGSCWIGRLVPHAFKFYFESHNVLHTPTQNCGTCQHSAQIDFSGHQYVDFFAGTVMAK